MLEGVVTLFHLAVEGVIKPSHTPLMPADALTGKCGAKVKGEYKLSGYADADLQECYKWFLEAIWCQAKSYTIFVWARSYFFATEMGPIA